MAKVRRAIIAHDEFWRFVAKLIKEGNTEAMKLWARYHKPGDPPKDVETR